MKHDLVWLWLIPATVIIMASILFRFSALDINVLKTLCLQHWIDFRLNPVWQFLYHYGNIVPGLIGLGGLLAVVVSFWSRSYLSLRKPGLFLVLMLLVGPGLVVNVLFKDNWGRPRPYETQLFGGDKEYLRLFDKGTPGNGASFPSSHAAMGFFVCAPFFLFWARGRKRLAATIFCVGFVYGTVIGFARITMGAHFPSDVLWAWAFTYMTGVALYYCFGFHRSGETSGSWFSNQSVTSAIRVATEDPEFPH